MHSLGCGGVPHLRAQECLPQPGVTALLRHLQPDGKIYADLDLLGAATSCFSRQDPNLQGLPKPLPAAGRGRSACEGIGQSIARTRVKRYVSAQREVRELHPLPGLRECSTRMPLGSCSRSSFIQENPLGGGAFYFPAGGGYNRSRTIRDLTLRRANVMHPLAPHTKKWLPIRIHGLR